MDDFKTRWTKEYEDGKWWLMAETAVLIGILIIFATVVLGTIYMRRSP